MPEAYEYQSKAERTTGHIKSWCEENEVDFHAYTEWHLSLTVNGKRLDIWPKSFKCHNVKANRHDVIKGDLIDYLNGWLNDEPEHTKKKETKHELLATYINNRFGTSLGPHHAEEIARYVLNNY